LREGKIEKGDPPQHGGAKAKLSKRASRRETASTRSPAFVLLDVTRRPTGKKIKWRRERRIDREKSSNKRSSGSSRDKQRRGRETVAETREQSSTHKPRREEGGKTEWVQMVLRH